MHVSFVGIRVCPSRGARGLLASNLGNHKPTPLDRTGMRLRILALVALCACAPPLARAEGDAPPLPDRNPLRPTKPVAAPAVEEKPVLPGEQPTVPWTEAEIDAAKAKCKELLTGDPLDYEILPPIKEQGKTCVAEGITRKNRTPDPLLPRPRGGISSNP